MESKLLPARVIYVSYDGMTDPLGRSQVLPYLTGLASLGHRIRLISLEKPNLFARDRDEVESICGEAAIEWHPLPYRQIQPILSGMVNVAALRRAAGRLHRTEAADLVHCRSDLAGLAGMALKRRHKVPLLYDMRAFWPDERVDGGSWDQRRLLYRTIFRHFKARQRDLLVAADHIVILTEEARKLLPTMQDIGGTPVTVIPCCAEFDHFPLLDSGARGNARAKLGIPPDAAVVAYLGSIGTWYMFDEMLDFFRTFAERHDDAQFLLVTPNDPAMITAAATARGIGAHQLVIRSASRAEVPHLMAAADVGLFFIKPCFSKKASSPTKLAEMLALGLPVVTNGDVGDVEAIVGDVGGGVVVRRFDAEAYRAAIDDLEHLSFSPEQIRARALAQFDVGIGIARYDAIYRQLRDIQVGVTNA